MAKRISTISEFSNFLNDNDLIYCGSGNSNPFSKLIDTRVWFEVDKFKTVQEIEQEYNVKLIILRGVR